MNEHFKLLGFKVKDVITNFTGVVTSISFDISGCVQGFVSPGLEKDGRPGDSRWFDTKRLKPLNGEFIMESPTFDVVPGGQELPKYSLKPIL